MSTYSVTELADRAGVTVDTVRYYQTRGLLPAPRREGRRARYDDHHLERLEAIKALKARGYSLALIQRTLEGELDPAEQALAGALVGEGGEVEEPLSRTALAERADVPESLLEALEREGLLVPRSDGEAPYTSADLAAVRAGSALLQAGLPLSELLALAREHDQAVRATAARAVDLFARFVRDPALGEAQDDQEAAERVVEALGAALPATSALVAHHFQRRVLAQARARLEGRALSPPDPDAEPAAGRDADAQEHREHREHQGHRERHG